MLRAVSLGFEILLVLALAIAAFALIGAYTFLPGLVGGLAAEAIQDRLNLEQQPEVELRSDPPPEMLLGRFSDGRVVIRDAEFGGLRTDEVVMNLDPFGMDPVESVRSRSLETPRPISGGLEVGIPEAEVRRLAETAGLEGVELREGGVVLTSVVRVLDVAVPVEVRGDVGLREDRIFFRPRTLSVVGEDMSPQVNRKVFRGAGFSFEVQGFPAGTELTAVDVEDGRLVLSGEIDNVLGS